MNDLKRAFSLDNLIRAWKWLNTNPSAQYKNFFRDSYIAYAYNYKENLKGLSERLRNQLYSPTEPALMLQPKTSCTTRPITLLAIEDQIVYQAMINIVAEQGYSKFKKRYYKTTFGNLYAGKNQLMFYRDWKKGYKLFNDTITSYYSLGFEYKASFDLASCYDSMDHKVLGYMLERHNLDKEFIDYLLDLLTKWSTNKKIYKSHGIPQGPLSSGLLSEVMLTYFDEQFEKLNLKSIQYLRYVDDIILMGKKEDELTYALATLDYRSKTIGLFPQSSKISIEKIENIDDVVNHVSNLNAVVFEASILKKYSDLDKCFKKTYKGNRITNKTQFKIVLPYLQSSVKYLNLVLKLLKSNPQYFMSISSFIKHYERNIPSSSIDLILDMLDRIDIYQVTKGYLIDAVEDKLKANDEVRFNDKILEIYRGKKYNNPYFKYIIIKYLLKRNILKYSELKALLKDMNSWWVKKSLLKYIDINNFGEPSYLELLKSYVNANNVIDCAIEGAKFVIETNVKVRGPYSEIHYIAQQTLRQNGIINRAKGIPCFIGNCFKDITEGKIKSFNWKKELGTRHKLIENKMIRAKIYYMSDITSFVNILDTVNDLLIEVVAQHDSSIGNYQLGNIGGYLSPTSKFAKEYPDFYAYCKEIHEKRLKSELSHAIHKGTKKATTYIPYRYRYEARRLMIDGINEIIEKW